MCRRSWKKSASVRHTRTQSRRTGTHRSMHTVDIIHFDWTRRAWIERLRISAIPVLRHAIHGNARSFTLTGQAVHSTRVYVYGGHLWFLKCQAPRQASGKIHISVHKSTRFPSCEIGLQERRTSFVGNDALKTRPSNTAGLTWGVEEYVKGGLLRRCGRRESIGLGRPFDIGLSVCKQRFEIRKQNCFKKPLRTWNETDQSLKSAEILHLILND
jgi:hypothetical protein